MKLEDFDYVLPKELIAQYPLTERDKARLMVVEREEERIEHCIFSDIAAYLYKEDIIILNNTKVLPARLNGVRASGAKVSVLLLRRRANLAFDALIKPSRVKTGERVFFNGGAIAGEVTAKNEITFFAEDKDSIYNIGAMPLPPYIKRDPEELDEVYYQTIYARHAGSIASPTAGLHFTKELLARIESSGARIAYITLHINYSTFKPVKASDITEHSMEAEYFSIADKTAGLIERNRLLKRRICAVGTTSARALETYASGIREGYTDLFIYPGYEFRMVNCLLTNFHLPRTTLFMLACAFAGERLIKKAYQEAVDKKYRFYSYGDAMLII